MWKLTSAEVYAVIFARHKNELSVHASYTDPTGDGYHFSSGRPEIMTEWGFEQATEPLLKIVQSKNKISEKEWKSEFFIYLSTLNTQDDATL